MSKISIVSLIYRSCRYAESTFDSLMANTAELHDGRAEFYFVANNATHEVREHLKAKDYPHQICDTPIHSDAELFAMGIGCPAYLHNVYKGWNHAIREADGEWVVLVSSDMVFSPGWLTALMRAANPKRVVVSQLVERNHPKFGVFPGALNCELGNHPDRFNHDGWESFVKMARKNDELGPGTAFGPLAIRRDVAIAAGLYPEGNICGAHFNIVRAYGDQYFFEKLASRGVEHVTVHDSLVYHFKEGEMEEPS